MIGRSPSQQPQKHSWAEHITSLGHAFRGLWYALRTERNTRVHTVIAVAAVGTGIALHISAIEFSMIFVAITGVFIAEMFNTVLELSIDLGSPDYHPLAKIAKDVSAGAVLLNSILAMMIALFVFGPHLWPLLVWILSHAP